MTRVVRAPRAATILYNLLVSRAERRPWLLPANICPIVPVTCAKAGVPFELVDISPATLHLDLERASDLVKTNRFGGLLYAHSYGDPSTPRPFFAHIKGLSPDLLVVDDRCLCEPELRDLSPSAADVVLYSTGYAKQVDLGSGGYAFIGADVPYSAVSLPFDATSYERLEASYKASIEQRTAFIYRDSDWLQTDGNLPTWADYRRQLRGERERWREHRARLVSIYTDALPRELQLDAAYQSWRFNVRVRNQQKLLTAIFSAGLFASRHYTSLSGIMAPGRSPQAERLGEEVVNLFIDRYFSQEQAEQTASIILENLR